MAETPLTLLRELIKAGCVNDGDPDSGQERRGADLLAGYLGEEGFIFEPHPGRVSTIYRTPGADPNAPTLVLLPHLDVVPADPGGWSVDPFAAEISDGFVWGRGAVDMLGLTAAMTEIFRRRLRGEVDPYPGDLVLAAVADEENSGTYGAARLVEEHWDLVGGEYLLTEVAYPSFPADDGLAHPVSVGEKGPQWRTLRTTGTPGHGSAPYGADNALKPMSEALRRLFDSPTPTSLTTEWSTFVHGLGLDDDLADALTNTDRLDEGIDEVAGTDPGLAGYLHAATHLTVSPNVVTGGIKQNVIAEHAEAELDIRIPPGMTARDVERHLKTTLSGLDVEWDALATDEATVSPTQGALWDAVGDAYEDRTGSRHILPTLMTVATDARFWRARGTTAYGVGLYDDRIPFGEFLRLFHGRDERISVDSIDRTVGLLETLITSLGNRVTS